MQFRYFGVLISLVALASIALVSPFALAQDPKEVKNSLSDLRWLTGAWHTSSATSQSEEHWTAPLGGTFLGVNRTIKSGKTVFYEYLRIEDRGDAGVFYVALPKGAAEETEFKLTEMKPNFVMFENPKHDFPKRISYALTTVKDQQILTATVDDGHEGSKKIVFQFKRGTLPG
jgi:hypothetical protein